MKLGQYERRSEVFSSPSVEIGSIWKRYKRDQYLPPAKMKNVSVRRSQYLIERGS
jgi:hypothetical protein